MGQEFHDSLQESRAGGTVRGMVATRSGNWRTALAPSRSRTRDRQLRLPPSVWTQLLADPAVLAAYHGRVHRRNPDECWYWLGAISQDGQAKMKIPGQDRVIAAVVFGWQVSRGPLRPGRDDRLPVIRHTCDEAACCNPLHWVTGTRSDNAADYADRKGTGPLADKRGPGPRARAIRDAIIASVKDGSDTEQAIIRAKSAGMPAIQVRLF